MVVVVETTSPLELVVPMDEFGLLIVSTVSFIVILTQDSKSFLFRIFGSSFVINGECIAAFDKSSNLF